MNHYDRINPFTDRNTKILMPFRRLCQFRPVSRPKPKGSHVILRRPKVAQIGRNVLPNEDLIPLPNQIWLTPTQSVILMLPRITPRYQMIFRDLDELAKAPCEILHI